MLHSASFSRWLSHAPSVSRCAPVARSHNGLRMSDEVNRRRTTIMRLAREPRDDQAVQALQSAYQSLAEGVLAVAAERGYPGDHPMEALEALRLPHPDVIRLGAVAADLWLAFFGCFRPDEQAFELQQFREAADPINRKLSLLPPGSKPDVEMTLEMLQTLHDLWFMRQETISKRLDQLIADLSKHQVQLGREQLTAAHSADELDRLAQALEAARIALGVPAGAEDKPAETLGRILVAMRDAIEAQRRDARGNIEAFHHFLRAVGAVCQRQPVPALPPEAERVIAQVRAIDDARRAQEVHLRESKALIEALRAEQGELQDALKEKDRRLTASEQPEPEADARLALYRQAFAILDQGGDPRPLLEQVRELERVVPLGREEQAALSRALDASHDELVRTLTALHKLTPLTDDPKRHRPRGLFGIGGRKSPERATVPGLVASLREAGRDLAVFAERARWTQGCLSFAREVPKLKMVFAELVRLVAHWRHQLGDPPPVSISISLDAGTGVLALPAVVVTDLEAIVKRRSKAAAAAQVLAPILEECAALYHAALVPALGIPIPRSQPASKREGPLQATSRLGAELAQLAGRCEAAFREAAQQAFQPDEADRRLLADDHLLRAGLGVLDRAAGECLGRRGVPVPPGGGFPPVPGRGDALAVHNAIAARVNWFEDLARHRFVVG